MVLPKINDTVIYGSSGVCRVIEIKEMELLGRSAEYYILKPIKDSRATVFLPRDNEILMQRVKPVLTAAEINTLIDGMPGEAEIWIENDAERKKRYSEILNIGDRKEIIRVIKTLYLKGKSRESVGKKLRISDANFLKEAEKQLYEEFSYVLGIDRDEVSDFILKRLGLSF